MGISELKKKTEKELHEILNNKRNELRELKFKDSERQLKNVRAIRDAKKTVARIMTVLNSDVNEA